MILSKAEIEKIKASNYWFGREQTERLLDTIETLTGLLTESLKYARHVPGCSGGIVTAHIHGTHLYQCKCGYRDWQAKAAGIEVGA